MIWFLKWLFYWAKFCEGLIGVVTLGVYSPSIALSIAGDLARRRARRNCPQPSLTERRTDEQNRV